MPDEDPAACAHLGVGLFVAAMTDGAPGDDEEYAPASGRQRARWGVARALE